MYCFLPFQLSLTPSHHLSPHLQCSVSSQNSLYTLESSTDHPSPLLPLYTLFKALCSMGPQGLCIYHPAQFGSVRSLLRCQRPSLSRAHLAAASDTISECYLGTKVPVPTNIGTCTSILFRLERCRGNHLYSTMNVLLCLFYPVSIHPASIHVFFNACPRKPQIPAHSLYEILQLTTAFASELRSSRNLP